jgi:hypothetical protein
MGLAGQWRQLWTRHRNAVLAAGGAAAVGGAVIVRKRSSSAGGTDVGYPAAMTGGATPTLDTTATDAYSQFSDQLGAAEDFQAAQYDKLNDTVGGLSDTVGALGNRVGRIGARVNKITHQKPPKAPRPKKPHQTPKAHHKPAPKPAPKTAAKSAGPVLHGGRPLSPLRPRKVTPPKPKRR